MISGIRVNTVISDQASTSVLLLAFRENMLVIRCRELLHLRLIIRFLGTCTVASGHD